MAVAARRQVIVVGAGIVGAVTALRLLDDGHDVLLLDRDAPGSGTSYGNAGSVSPGSIVPLSLPGTVRSIPGWLANPLGPLSIAPLQAPGLLPFLYRFWRAGSPRRVEAIVSAMRLLNGGSVAAYSDLLSRAGAPELLVSAGMLHAYRTQTAFDASAFARELRQRHGVPLEVLDADGISRYAPALAAGYRHGFYLPDGAHVRSPQRVVTAIAGLFTRRGGRVERADILRVRVGAGRVLGVLTRGGAIDAEAVVLCTGIGATPLARQLGIHVPMAAERGYHIEIPDAGVHLDVPVTDAQAKCVATPMDAGLRIAGTSEFTHPGAPPNWRRAAVLEHNARAMFPGIRIRDVRRWAGHRPTTPDSLPILCETPGTRDLFFAFGHGHWGLMAAPASARIVADLVARRDPPAARQFHINRF